MIRTELPQSGSADSALFAKALKGVSMVLFVHLDAQHNSWTLLMLGYSMGTL